MTQSLPRLRLGTRGSPLALWQAHAVRDALVKAHGWAPEAVEVQVIRTTGDAITDRALSEAGGKGLFTKELEEALLDRRIDLAVHSAKDMATKLPDGLHLVGYLPRADVRDALILREGSSLADLKPGAKVGTASLRREAQLRRLRPDLQVSLLRGNVHTRLSKVESGEFDGTLLALAGLTRLGMADKASALLDVADFLPAVGQGAVAIESRFGDIAVDALLVPVTCPATGLALRVERAYLGELDGSCRTPIGGLAEVQGEEIRFRGVVLSPDGSRYYEIVRYGPANRALELGLAAGQEMRAMVPADLLPH
ncbi:porphobilinogen deaminase [Ancylobacter novellus DSM 506]|uniref:Porphobilinogen deaminase n=1 Tax=Ancylobacter novellus (strain ATCC 8093 / DSM 506 / JCM 20403 / CCM 1077 / IAM 12100 / NBRC 12443 / NCIMB 10456) TaxID=639283 RepID=D7A5X9_ANCN5|nr:hydroxymethylbilane synthase [Ancylobacter novellus]ADH90094.1 porphobilinogen deaminase [Ancylobacter novellus DSM 506]